MALPPQDPAVVTDLERPSIVVPFLNIFEEVIWTRFCDYVLIFVIAASLYAATIHNFGLYNAWPQRLTGVVFITGVGTYGYFSRAPWRAAIMALLFIAVVLVGCGFLREVGYDGLKYHSATPLNMDHGISGSDHMSAPTGMFWAVHYPKAFEYFAYTAKILTGKFNSGKAYTFLLSIPALTVLMLLFRTAGQSRATALVAAAACVFNPVAIGQMTTLYVDAAHYFCWVIFSVNLLFAMRGLAYSAAQMGAALALLVDSKMTGLVFAPIVILVFFGAAFIAGERRKFFSRYKGHIAQLAIWLFVGIAIAGFSPYIENLAAGKGILYPLAGAGKVDIMSKQASPKFQSKNRVQKFFLSYFAVPGNSMTAEPVYSPSKEHLREGFIALHSTDTRFGGMGPFFGLMLIISILPFFWKKMQTGIVTTFLIATAATILIHPESWWARYVPMLYIVPFLMVAAFSASRLQFRAIIALGLMNSFLTLASVTAYVFVKQSHYNREVAAVRQTCDHRPIALPFDSLNWEFDLHDDRLRTTPNGAAGPQDCAINFDDMMLLKK